MRQLCTALTLLLALKSGSVAQDKTKPADDTIAYCSQAATYSRQHAGRALFFTAIPRNRDPGRDDWSRAASEAAVDTAANNADSTAGVTVRDGRVIAADFTFQSQFGDSTETVRYCFRPDGTLAEVHSDLKSFHGGMKVVRELGFDDAGKQLSSTMKSFDLESGKPAKLPPDFWDFPPPIFLRVSDLPFAKDLP